MKDKVRGMLLGGCIITSIFASHLAMDLMQIYKGDKNIWWSPRSMMLSLQDSRDTFELYISGKGLIEHIGERTLFAKDSEGKMYKVVSQDIGIRVNNWYRRKCSLLERVPWSSFITGFGLALLIMGLYIKRTVLPSNWNNASK